MALTENPFRDLYDYSGSTGTVIPQTSDVKEMVRTAFNTIFGTDVSTDDETPMGRFVEAITMLIVNVLGVNAQNANMLNPRLAVGNALDNIGAIFGIVRGEGMGDSEYRGLILAGQSNGKGFLESIVQRTLAVSGVKSVVVLNNGTADPSIEPRGEAYSINVPPHSVFISVRGGADEDVAEAISKTISVGCGMENDDAHAGDAVEEQIGTQNIVFYRPDTPIENIKVSIGIKPDGYSGNNIESDVSDTVMEYLRANDIPGAITNAKIADYVNSSGIGVVCTSVEISVDSVVQESIVMYPCDYIDFESAQVEVTV